MKNLFSNRSLQALRDYIQSTKELAEQQDKKINIILEDCATRVDLDKYTGFSQVVSTSLEIQLTMV